jgi:hypothetical protein
MIFCGNIMAVAEDRIRHIRVDYIIVGGSIIYTRMPYNLLLYSSNIIKGILDLHQQENLLQKRKLYRAL